MDTWEQLRSDCESCEKCALNETKTNCVFGTGNTGADLLFVGEAPGENEDMRSRNNRDFSSFSLRLACTFAQTRV